MIQGSFVRTLQERQGLQTGSPDEIAHALGWIDETRQVMKKMRHFCEEIEELLFGNAIFQTRTRGIGLTRSSGGHAPAHADAAGNGTAVRA